MSASEKLEPLVGTDVFRVYARRAARPHERSATTARALCMSRQAVHRALQRLRVLGVDVPGPVESAP